MYQCKQREQNDRTRGRRVSKRRSGLCFVAPCHLDRAALNDWTGVVVAQLALSVLVCERLFLFVVVVWLLELVVGLEYRSS